MGSLIFGKARNNADSDSDFDSNHIRENVPQTHLLPKFSLSCQKLSKTIRGDNNTTLIAIAKNLEKSIINSNRLPFV